MPTYPRHPLALAQQAATAQVFCGGRLTLGVGVSHRPVIEGLHGLPYAAPAAHMREYLSVLGPLLRGEAVQFRGEHYRVDGGFAVPGAAPVPVLVGALSPRMVQVAGELADGVITWLAGPRTLAAIIVPNLQAAAPRPDRAAGRRRPPGRGHRRPGRGPGRRGPVFARYNGLENYRRLLEREGAASVADLAVVGTEADVEQQLRRYADVGVTELWPASIRSGDDADASLRRTRALLAGLAR